MMLESYGNPRATRFLPCLALAKSIYQSERVKEIFQSSCLHFQLCPCSACNHACPGGPQLANLAQACVRTLWMECTITSFQTWTTLTK